ncbi:MAG: peptidoglycan DD-metalloendopeptidase family protein [Candidatus Cryptobacteroides sp.]
MGTFHRNCIKCLLAISTLLTIQSFSTDFEDKGKGQEANRVKPIRSVKEAEVILPRTAFLPVKSLVTGTVRPVDTLRTENEFVSVVLYDDYTWRYLKDPAAVSDRDIFTKYWNNTEIDPYKMKIDSLPVSWSVWMVDSLSQYHCPYQGALHPRGKFGIRRGRRHQGVDLPLSVGAPIYATFDGKVRMSKYVKGYGNFIIIRHENGLETFYGHLSQRNVEADQWVHAGDVIGLGGSTGRSTGPHLHFETRYRGYAFDPQWLINFETGELRHRLFLLKRRQFNPYSNYEQDFEDEFRNDEEDRKEDAERAAMRYHTVRSGDTLGRIAINNGTTVTELCRLNGLTRNSILRIGQRIRVR